MKNIKIKKFQNKKNKKKLVCLTSYSKNVAKLIDEFCDLVLVGDSMANVLYGMKNTHILSLNTIINHAKSVKEGISKSLLVVDMPKNSYKSINQAKKNAKLILKKTKCDAIKIENNTKNLKIVKALVGSGINVMGHIGYTPQFKSKFRAEGKTLTEQKKLINEAKKIEKAGAFSIVLECISKRTSLKITQTIKIPTIGIGSSAFCDGQILVTDDILGLSGFYPRFVKKYSNFEYLIKKSAKMFSKDVITQKFPTNKNSY